jgi:2,6-dihydroxypyridine 3-monooxygenase
MPKVSPRAVIMGGSIAGLTAALVLRDNGWDVDVFERSSALLENRGAGIISHPITLRYASEFAGYGLDELSIKPVWCRYVNDYGKVVSERSCHFRVNSYGTLYRALLHAFGMERLHLGRSVVGFHEEGSQVKIFLSDNDIKMADLLVCADGINSTARKLMVPDASPEYAGYVAWRGTVGKESLGGETFKALQEAITYHLMADGHLLAYPILARNRLTGKGERLINWLWYVNVPEGDALDDLLTDRDGVLRDTSLANKTLQEKHIAGLRQDARETLPPSFAELVLSTQEPFIQAVFDGVISTMAFGRVCIMGDAAFAARPHCGAGTAKASEDAWQLRNALAQTNNDVPVALQHWQERQLQCGSQLVARAREIGHRLQFENNWPVGQGFPFGLYEPGDSAFEIVSTEVELSS